MKQKESKSTPIEQRPFDLEGQVITSTLYRYVEDMENFSQRQLTKGVLTGISDHFSNRAGVALLDKHPQKCKSEHDLWFLITYRN